MRGNWTLLEISIYNEISKLHEANYSVEQAQCSYSIKNILLQTVCCRIQLIVRTAWIIFSIPRVDGTEITSSSQSTSVYSKLLVSVMSLGNYFPADPSPYMLGIGRYQNFGRYTVLFINFCSIFID